MKSSAPLIVLGEISKELIAAPFWWYTIGAHRAFERFRLRLREGNAYIGWSVWVNNLFTPMYAQHDWAGRLISLFIRLVQIIVRSLLLILWLTVCFVLLGLYFALPVLVISEIIYQIYGI